jgi:hypothetical protein
MATYDLIKLSGAALLTIVKNYIDDSAPGELERVVEVLFGCKFDSIYSPVLKLHKCKSIYTTFGLTPSNKFVETMASVIASDHPEIEPLEDELEIFDEDEEDEE